MTLKFGFILTLLTVLTAPAQEYRLELKEAGQQLDWRLGERRSFVLTLQGLAVNNDGAASLVSMDSGSNTPTFSSRFSMTPKNEGDYQVGPFTTEIHGVTVTSNVLTYQILPRWDGKPAVNFQVDKEEITLGESFTLSLETINKEKTKDKARLRSLDGEFDVLSSGSGGSSGKTKEGWPKYSQRYNWEIRPLKPGPFELSSEHFTSFPEDVYMPPITVNVLSEKP